MDNQDKKPVDEKPAVKEKPAAKRGDTYKNIADCGVFICGTKVKPGKEYTLTEADKGQERSMAKIKNAVKLGLIEKV